MNSIQKQMQKIKGNKLLRQLPKSQRLKYYRLCDQLRAQKQGNGAGKTSAKAKTNTGLWLVSVKDGTPVFRSKGKTLYGVTPQEFAAFEKSHAKFAKRKNKRVRGVA